MVSLEEFMKNVVTYLEHNDIDLMYKISKLFLTDKCKDELTTGFNHAYIKYVFRKNIESSINEIRKYIEKCK